MARAESQRLNAKLGEVMIERQLLHERSPRWRLIALLVSAEAEAMSRTISPLSGKLEGLALVWRTRRVPRATVYRHRGPQQDSAPQRSGPVGPMADAALLEHIRAVLAASPFMARGIEVWAAAADRRDPDFAAARAASDA